MIKTLKEVEERLIHLPPPENPSKWKAKDYVGGGMSALKYLDIKIPRVRAALKEPFSFSNQSLEKQWKIWDYVWNQSRYFEVMLGATHFAAKRPIEELHQMRKTLIKWVERVDNWAHSDELSGIYSKLLEHDPKSMLPVFEKWNRSKNPWLKRQSMVGLLFYSRFRNRTPEVKLILRFVERHMEDDHYYVQKGVGWTLRECWSVYPETTFKYLCKNAKRIPSAGWTAATERLSKKDKELLLRLRKADQLSKRDSRRTSFTKR